MTKITISYKGVKFEFTVRNDFLPTEITLSERQVRELASQLPKETLDKLIDCKEETEQQKVSDCCGAELLVVETEEDSYNWYACSECRTPCQETEPCDAVEPDEKIEKLPTVSNIFLEKQENKERVILRNRIKLNEIIEKINNE